MPASNITVEPERDRIVHIYPDRVVRTSSGSVRSPASSRGDRSLSSEDSSWSDVGYDDGIDPSDSASRSRHPRSRRHTTEVRDAPPRHAARSIVDDREDSLPRRRASHSQHRRHESRHARSQSRRPPSDESTASLASPDDYPYGHHGMPRAPPPPSGFRHVPAPRHGGYYDPYDSQAMVHMQRHDHFALPHQSNPFASQPSQPNPFASPMGNDSGASYFESHLSRPPGPARPQSFAAPSYYGNELMAPFQHGYPYGHPPPMPPYWHNPRSQGSTPAPKDEEAIKTLGEIEALKLMIQKQNEAMEAAKPKPKVIDPELEGQRELLKKLQEDLLAQQKLLAKEREAEAAAKAEAKAKAEEEQRRKDDISAATKAAKEEAEKAAAEAAAKAKEEADKKLAEAELAKAELDKAKKALEEEIAKNKPTPDSLKAPIKFKDAVGRKFSFPWHLCKTWKGMEGLIKQAFLHVDLIGQHVHEGHYDLTGPDGEIILPQVWENMVQPDWEITMHLWPMPEEEPKKKDIDPYANMSLENLGLGPPPPHGLHKSKSAGKKDKKGKNRMSAHHDFIDIGPIPDDPFAGLGALPPGISVVSVDEKKSSKPKSKPRSKSSGLGALGAWMAYGGGASSSKSRSRK